MSTLSKLPSIIMVHYVCAEEGNEKQKSKAPHNTVKRSSSFPQLNHKGFHLHDILVDYRRKFCFQSLQPVC